MVVLPSWRQVVDLGNLEASVGVHTTGQSGNPTSPHWNDQVDLWARGEHHPLPLARAQVQTHAESSTVLVPR